MPDDKEGGVPPPTAPTSTPAEKAEARPVDDTKSTPPPGGPAPAKTTEAKTGEPAAPTKADEKASQEPRNPTEEGTGQVATIGGDLSGMNVGGRFVADRGGQVFVNLYKDLKDRKRAPADKRPRPWRDPSKTFSLPKPKGGFAQADLDRAVEHLRSHRILLVECIDGDLQWEAAAAVFNALSVQIPTVRGVVSDDVRSGAATDGDGDARGERSRWDDRAILHPNLGGGACALFLELDGVNGQVLPDQIFRTRGAYDGFSQALRERSRYLVLLPRGRTGTVLAAGIAKRGFVLPSLTVDFLEPWLLRRFPDEASVVAEGIRKLLQRNEWNGSQEALYEWLCGVGQQGADGRKLLEQLEGYRPDPSLTSAFEAALESTDGAQEPKLAAVFVATFLPGLAQHDFFRVVEALLAGRTRKTVVSTPVSDTATSRGPTTVEISLVAEWRDGVRAIMRDANLELRVGPSGSRTVWCRDVQAASQIRKTLEQSPLFVDQQMERLRRSGLLFDASEGLGWAMVALVAAVVSADPLRYDAQWLCALLLRVEPHQGSDLQSAQEPGAQLQEPPVRQLVGAQNLLRRLLDDGMAGAGLSGAASRPEASIVDAVLERIIRFSPASGAVFLLELAFRLRAAPGFDHWYWIGQVLERGSEEARDRALQVIDRLIVSDEPGAEADLGKLLSLLSGPNTGQGGDAAIRAMLGLAMDSIHFVGGERSRRLTAVSGVLRRAASDGEMCGQLVSALFHADVIAALALEQRGLATDVAALFLPPQIFELELEAGLKGWQSIVNAWNETFDDLTLHADDEELPRYLMPALTLAAWSELFAEEPAAMRQMAERFRAGQKASVRSAVQVWLGVLIAVALASEDYGVTEVGLEEGIRAEFVRVCKGRRERLVNLQKYLNGFGGTATTRSAS